MNEARITRGVHKKGYRSWSAFRRVLGKAEPGKEWHHIVEQSKTEIFGSEWINNARNMIQLDIETHSKVSAYYSTKQVWTCGKTVREWLNSKSFVFQRDFGIKYLRSLGVDI